MQLIQSLGQAEAQLALQAMRTELERRGQAAVIVVADAHGELIALLRLDGAPLPSIVIASNKAWTAARERKPSYDIGQGARNPTTGLSSMVNTSEAWTTRTRGSRKPSRFIAAPTSSSFPTRNSSVMVASSSSACLAPPMTTSQPWSPPMTSTTIRIMEARAGSQADLPAPEP